MDDAETKEKRLQRLQLQKRHSQSDDMEPISEAMVMTASLASSVGTGGVPPADEVDKKSPRLLPLDLQKMMTQAVEKEPGKIEGYLLKRRKRPMKGWHKRYFVLEKGMLTYGKNCGELMKGKIHGTIDVLAAVISTEKEEDRKARRIDIDTEEFLYHVKATSHEEFLAWRNHLQLHQGYRKQIQTAAETLVNGPTNQRHLAASPTSEITLKAMTLERRRLSLRKQMSKYRMPGPVSVQNSGSWKTEMSELDKCSKELTEAENSIVMLSNIIQDLLNQELPFPWGTQEPEVDGQKRSKGKLSLRKGKTKKATTSEQAVGDVRRSSNSSTVPGASLGTDTMQSIASSKQPVEESNPRDDFMDMANQVHRILKSVLYLLSVQHDRLRYVIESQNSAGGAASQSRQITILQEALAKARSQNEDMRGRLTRIFEESNIRDLSPPIKSDTELMGGGALETLLTKLTRSMSGEMIEDGMVTVKPYVLSPQLSDDRELSRSESLLEFYDALEYPGSSDASSSEDEEEIESSSLASEEEAEIREEDFLGLEEEDTEGLGKSQTGRRTQLPAPQPDTSGLSLWNILKKNIGKDLSKIAMPVALNEPLSMLQVLAEELEYSELLDKAAETDDPYWRMVHVAAFAASSYASTYYRAGTKPFNPLLGETYECVREDKGFRFIAEQVSHHPPISACHCESKNFIYSQEVKIKTKFWGKSMEIIPAGNIVISIPRYNDTYKFNKVTSCVHNILSGERWLDHYGECLITNGRLICKLTFTKASYWSNRRHEVHGLVMEDGQVIHELFGKWNEGMYCGRSASAKCIWRTGSMPENHSMFYGFTRFAIELNELDPNTRHLLPPTESRLRPDQRKLEDGDVIVAEREKQRLEGLQRERRKWRDEQGITYEPKFFRLAKENGKEVWVFKNDYWNLRRDPGFKNLSMTELW